MRPRFIAYEINEDGSFNDEGNICTSVEKAWDEVSGCFSIDHTVIEDLRTGKFVRPIQEKPKFIKATTPACFSY